LSRFQRGKQRVGIDIADLDRTSILQLDRDSGAEPDQTVGLPAILGLEKMVTFRLF